MYGLCNSGEKKLQFTPFWGVPKPGCSDGLRVRIIESHNFFVLRPILVKLHIRTRLIESFPTTYWLGWCAEEKLHFTPVHTLCQLKRYEALFPPLQISVACRNGLKNLPRQFFFPGNFLVCVWSLVAIRAEMSTHLAFTHTHTHTYTHTHIHEWNYILGEPTIVDNKNITIWPFYNEKYISDKLTI